MKARKVRYHMWDMYITGEGVEGEVELPRMGSYKVPIRFLGVAENPWSGVFVGEGVIIHLPRNLLREIDIVLSGMGGTPDNVRIAYYPWGMLEFTAPRGQVFVRAFGTRLHNPPFGRILA